MSKVIAVVSGEYRKTVELLKQDPIIREMAEDAAHLSAEELESFAFMSAALRRYHERGGKIPTHVGGPMEAILALRG